jgi:hypothetical protein
MSTDFLLDFLTSIEFIGVDQPLFTALELLKREHDRDHFPVHPCVWRSAEEARRTSDLSLKKAWFLVLLAMFPPMQEHVCATAPSEDKAKRFVEWLRTEVDALFGGKYYVCENPLSEFVGTSISSYCSLV